MNRLIVQSVVRRSATSNNTSLLRTNFQRSRGSLGANPNYSHTNYHTSTPAYKIHSNSDLTQAEMEKLMDDAMAEKKAEEAAKFNPDWKPGYRKRPLRFAHTLEEFENEISPTYWQPNLNKRCGALGIKLGMMPLWDNWGERHACTVLYLDNNVVMKTFKEGKDGYTSVQLGAGERKKKNVTKPLLGHYKNCNVDENPPYIVREFRVTDEDYLPEPGTIIHARHFVPGQNIDVSGISKGKGFQGAMKRWNFSGMPATHGTSLSHRSLGSTGQCQDPGRVFKGKKMAGRMGTDRVTTQNLRIVKIDRGRNLLYVKGAVPGNKGEFVEIRDAIKKPLFGTEKVEDEVKFPPLPTFDFEEGVDGSQEEGHEVLMPQQKEDPFDPPVLDAA